MRSYRKNFDKFLEKSSTKFVTKIDIWFVGNLLEINMGRAKVLDGELIPLHNHTSIT